ncbi:MAG: hypothetical protein FWD31_06385 [Planctomycetaceae bacterium]|nr:hypothetical protein [Planctomycetaceae bacterium]
MIQRSSVMFFLIVSVIAMSGVDAFGQLFRRNNAQLVRPVARESFKVEIILESNLSLATHPEWKHVTTQGGRPPVRRVIQTPNIPGAPTILSWDFGEMSASPASRTTKFRYTFSDSDDIMQSAEFTFYPREGKVRFEINESIGLNWEFDEEASKNLAPTQKTVSAPPRNMVGASTIEEWTLGRILDGKAEGTAVFMFDYRGEGHTKVVIKLRK